MKTFITTLLAVALLSTPGASLSTGGGTVPPAPDRRELANSNDGFGGIERQPGPPSGDYQAASTGRPERGLLWVDYEGDGEWDEVIVVPVFI